MNIETSPFLDGDSVPFAMARRERLEKCRVPGHYDEKEQVWKGAEDLPLAMAPTATSTVPSDYDQD